MTLPWIDTARSAVRVGLGAELGGLSSTEVIVALRQVEALRRQLAAVDLALVAELINAGAAQEFARPTTADLLVTELRVSPGEAKARVARAGDLGPRRALTGESLPPLMPATAAALAEGIVSVEHVRVITDCLEALGNAVDLAGAGVVETTLISAAQHEHPAMLRRTASMLIARLDPDGLEPREEQIERRREVTLVRNGDGSGRLTGRLTVETALIWDTILDSLSAPCPSDGGEIDPRSAAQRRHDGLAEAGQRLLRSASLPAAGGVPVTILARTTVAELESGTGVAQSSRGDVLAIRALTAMCSDSEIVPVVCDDDGAVLALGRTRRLASRAQRLALAARDGGCTFPACERPAAWTEVHHVRPWQDGGPTYLSNLCLLCRYHHRSFEASGGFRRSSQHVSLPVRVALH